MTINISCEIERLIQYGLDKELISKHDIIYTKNRILEVLEIDEIDEFAKEKEELNSSESILEAMIEWAIDQNKLQNNIIYKDLFDTKVMGCLIPRPSEVITKFEALYKEDSIKATDYFYNISKHSNYIRTDRIKKDLKWITPTEYGDIEITINMSKPEIDPKDIAAARKGQSNKYPKCLLCKENEGYAGRVNHPARQNHRIIPITLHDERWFFQYSPYAYYSEHCIIFKDEHKPMEISEKTFVRLLEFVNKFPHYFLGSNADLPIVGGSILSHDHFQGGRHEFAMAKAKTGEKRYIKNYTGITIAKVKWPMSVLRIDGNDIAMLVKAAKYIFDKWKIYNDDSVDIISHSNNIPHNTITPIARMRNGKFEIDLVLRNNRTSEEYPDGIFHPHKELHHIKKENIGLIEVMGLAVLPSRLSTELKHISYCLINKDKAEEIDSNQNLYKHKNWYIDLLDKYPDLNESNVEEVIKHEVSLKFLKVLEHASVFKQDRKGQEAFDKFISTL